MVCCPTCKFQSKVLLKHETCKCGANILFLDQLFIIKMVKTESAEGIIYQCYHLQNKKVCALKERLHDDERSKNRFERENFILKKLCKSFAKENNIDLLYSFRPFMDYFFTISKYICFEWIDDSVSLDSLNLAQNNRLEKLIYSVK